MWGRGGAWWASVPPAHHDLGDAHCSQAAVTEYRPSAVWTAGTHASQFWRWTGTDRGALSADSVPTEGVLPRFVGGRPLAALQDVTPGDICQHLEPVLVVTAGDGAQCATGF